MVCDIHIAFCYTSKQKFLSLGIQYLCPIAITCNLSSVLCGYVYVQRRSNNEITTKHVYHWDTSCAMYIIYNTMCVYSQPA